MAKTNTKTAINEIRKKRKQLIADLRERRQELRQEIQTINQQIDELTGRNTTSSLKNHILEIVEEAEDEGVSAPEIISQLRSDIDDLRVDLVHSHLHRLVAQGKLVAEGDRGSRLYYIPDDE